MDADQAARDMRLLREAMAVSLGLGSLADLRAVLNEQADKWWVPRARHDELRAERDRLRRELDEARCALAEAGRCHANGDAEGARLLLCDSDAARHAHELLHELLDDDP